MFSIRTLILATSSLLITIFNTHAETVTIGVLTSAGIQKTVFLRHKETFEQQNSGITIEYLFRSDSEFKEDLPNWLASNNGPDILTWQGGRRVYKYVEQGLVKDISDFYQTHQLHNSIAQGAIAAASLNGKQYGVPYSYYHWGFYYRASVFEKLNLTAPQTWDEFIMVGKTLKQNGIVPITIGATNNWPSAAWFDYLNLRINGLSFHQSLLNGEISFKDNRVIKVFEHWKQLVDNGFFTDRLNGWTWLQAMPFTYHKLAGMTLIGNFFAGEMPRVLRDDFRFFRFPIIDPTVDLYEEAPMDLFMVPSNKQMTSAIKKVLLMLASVEFQQDFNETSGMIAPHLKTAKNNDYFIQEGQKTLNQAKGVAQFFDRDTTSDLASIGTVAFTEFINDGDIDKVTTTLENARQRYF